MVEFGDVALACVRGNDILCVAMLMLMTLSYLVSYWNTTLFVVDAFRRWDIGWLLLLDESVFLVVAYDM